MNLRFYPSLYIVQPYHRTNAFKDLNRGFRLQPRGLLLLGHVLDSSRFCTMVSSLLLRYHNSCDALSHTHRQKSVYMCVNIHTYTHNVHAYIYTQALAPSIETYIHSYVRTYMHAYIHACMHAYARARTYTDRCIRTHTPTHPYMHRITCVCIYAYTHYIGIVSAFRSTFSSSALQHPVNL